MGLRAVYERVRGEGIYSGRELFKGEDGIYKERGITHKGFTFMGK